MWKQNEVKKKYMRWRNAEKLWYLMSRRCQLAADAEERRRKVSVLESESEDESMKWTRLLGAIPRRSDNEQTRARSYLLHQGPKVPIVGSPVLYPMEGLKAPKPMETMGDAMKACA